MILLVLPAFICLAYIPLVFVMIIILIIATICAYMYRKFKIVVHSDFKNQAARITLRDTSHSARDTHLDSLNNFHWNNFGIHLDTFHDGFIGKYNIFYTLHHCYVGIRILLRTNLEVYG